jgi:Tfp pilus assembly protein PilO
MNLLIQGPAPPVPPDPTQVIVQGPDPNWIIPQVVEAIAIVFVVAAITIAAVKIFGPLIAAWARRLEGRGGESALRGELEQVRHELAEVDSLRARVGELEERVDFTERLLANQRSESQLPREGPG